MSDPKRIMLITGAAGGIGRATVQLFAQNGWTVIGVDRAPFGEPFPSDGFFIQADIADPAALESIIAQTRSFTHTLDALVRLRTQIAESQALVFHKEVADRIAPALDDPKRAVRQRAVRARNAWLSFC